MSIDVDIDRDHTNGFARDDTNELARDDGDDFARDNAYDFAVEDVDDFARDNADDIIMLHSCIRIVMCIFAIVSPPFILLLSPCLIVIL